MNKKTTTDLLEKHLPSSLMRNSSTLSDNIEPYKNGFEFYMRSSHRIEDGHFLKRITEKLSKDINMQVDYKLCDRDYDFYLLIGDSYKEIPILEIGDSKKETPIPEIEYPDFWKEEVKILGNHEFLKNEVAPLLEELGYKRINHYSWSFHFDQIYIYSASKTTLVFEKGAFKSSFSVPGLPGGSYFRTKIITIEDIKQMIKIHRK